MHSKYSTIISCAHNAAVLIMALIIDSVGELLNKAIGNKIIAIDLELLHQ